VRILYYALSLSLFFFQGCGKEQPQAPSLGVLTQLKTAFSKDTSNDALTESFEDEFTQDEATQSTDNFSGYNRVMTTFNDFFFNAILDPASEVYAKVTPQPVRVGVSNFVQNIQFPVRFTNNLLQGKLQNSKDELESFLTNSTIGLGGLMNPAQDILHIRIHDEDFGQTLGYYNITPGPHIVLPFLGPSNMRDLIGVTVDAYVSPLVNTDGLEQYKIPDNLTQSIAIIAVQLTNKNSLNPGIYQSLKKDALDLYPFLKDAYEQKRAAEIAQ